MHGYVSLTRTEAAGRCQLGAAQLLPIRRLLCEKKAGFHQPGGGAAGASYRLAQARLARRTPTFRPAPPRPCTTQSPGPRLRSRNPRRTAARVVPPEPASDQLKGSDCVMFYLGPCFAKTSLPQKPQRTGCLAKSRNQRSHKEFQVVLAV